VAVARAPVEAAGGVVTRRSCAGATEVLVVHRPRYDDWSLPKGKLQPGEEHIDAAIREVAEETGWEVAVGHELPAVRYRDRHDRPKHVRYWHMTPVRSEPFTPNEEVDEVRWLSFDEAATLLSYDLDRRLLEQLGAGELQ
jgi:8-oxo-dGTP pyrophosphatase MutT (NUDIX family)